MIDAIGGWGTLIGGSLTVAVTAILAWIGGVSRTRRQLSSDSVAVANDDATVSMLKTLQEREAATNDRANMLAQKERDTFELYVNANAKLDAALRDLARLRDNPRSDWGDLETNLGDLPR